MVLMMVASQVIIANKGPVSASAKPPTDQKLRELRTLKQHYYPEGGWGWVVLAVSCLVHGLVLGTQVVLATVIISLGQPSSVSRRLQPAVTSAASKCSSVDIVSRVINILMLQTINWRSCTITME